MNNCKEERKRKLWTLDDGRQLSCYDLMKEIGCVYSTAFARLSKSTDPKYIFRERQETQGGKVYTLDDGSKWTVNGLADHLDCLRTTAGVRLSSSNSAERVLKPVVTERRGSEYNVNEYNSKVIKARIAKRMFFDPLGHWKLINKATSTHLQPVKVKEK